MENQLNDRKRCRRGIGSQVQSSPHWCLDYLTCITTTFAIHHNLYHPPQTLLSITSPAVNYKVLQSITAIRHMFCCPLHAPTSNTMSTTNSADHTQRKSRERHQVNQRCVIIQRKATGQSVERHGPIKGVCEAVTRERHQGRSHVCWGERTRETDQAVSKVSEVGESDGATRETDQAVSKVSGVGRRESRE